MGNDSVSHWWNQKAVWLQLSLVDFFFPPPLPFFLPSPWCCVSTPRAADGGLTGLCWSAGVGGCRGGAAGRFGGRAEDSSTRLADRTLVDNTIGSSHVGQLIQALAWPSERSSFLQQEQQKMSCARFASRWRRESSLEASKRRHWLDREALALVIIGVHRKCTKASFSGLGGRRDSCGRHRPGVPGAARSWFQGGWRMGRRAW